MKTTLKTEITVKDICEGFVYNEYEGKGLAAEGYRAVEQWMRKQNMHTIRLLVLAKNRRGQQFWLKMGFVKAGEKYIHLHQQEHRVWRMEKCLSEK